MDVVVHRKRRELIEDLKRVFNTPVVYRVETKKIERLLDILNQTYKQPAEDVSCLLVWDLQLALAGIYATQNKASKSMEWVVRVFSSLGFVIVGTNTSRTRFAIVRWGLLMNYLVETSLHVRAKRLR